MEFPERFSNLSEYAFPRLRRLLEDHPAGGDVMHMTIGEPRHEFPTWVSDEIAAHAQEFGKYPPNDGLPELRQAISDWLGRRFGTRLDPETRIMALNGTREGLFNAMVALCPEKKNGKRPKVLIPNPFYQVYMIGTLSVGAEPVYVPATEETGHLPDYASLPKDVLDQVSVAFLCSPSNPQGAVASWRYLETLLRLAETHDFRVFVDECYSEVYRDKPPAGILDVAAEIGANPERVVVFHSLSKRSNLPGLRSGFVAAGPDSMKNIKQLRAYAGAPIPMPIQRASIRIWNDEEHVEVSRKRYQVKYEIADSILGNIPGYQSPEAGFFLWLPVEDGEAAAIKLWCDTGIRVLPGAYLAQDVDGVNPGKGYIRVAMVLNEDELADGLSRLSASLF